MKKIKLKVVMLLTLSLMASVMLLGATQINAASDPADAPADWAFEASSVALNDAIVAKYPALNNGDGFVTISAANAMTGIIQIIGQDIPGTLNGIENFTSITGLQLYVNKLSGEIPSGLGNLTNLTDLNLGGNQLEGNIPTNLGNLINLKSLHLNGNKFSNEIPTSLGNLSKLTLLELSSNQLVGTIPSSLGGLSELTSLELVRNQLSGEIPTSLGNLNKLISLDLNNNQLSGEIPSSLGNLSNLTHLNLNSNQLSGEIPSSLTALNNLAIFSGDNNQFTSITQSTYNFLESISYYSVSNQTSINSIATAGTALEPFEFSGLLAHEQFPNYGVTFEYVLTSPDGISNTVQPTISNGKIVIEGSDLPQKGNYTLVSTGTSSNANFTNIVYTTNFVIEEATLVSPSKPIVPATPEGEKKPDMQASSKNVNAESVKTGDRNTYSSIVMLAAGLLISGGYLIIRKRMTH